VAPLLLLLADDPTARHSITQDLVSLGVSLILILINAFFVLAEFAIVKVRSTKIRELAQTGGASAKLAEKILGRMDVYLAACQLGITIASLAIGWLAEPSLAGLLGRLFDLTGWIKSALSHGLAFGIALVVITAVHVVVGEQVPKMLGILKPESSALLVARPLRWFYLLFYPFLVALQSTTNACLRLAGIKPASEHDVAFSEEELKMVLGASHEQGAFTLSRLLMMENILDFGQLTVDDVYVKAAEVTLLDPAKPWSENLAIIRPRVHSRYPLKESRIRRIIHVKDIAMAIADKGSVDLNAIARPVYPVASSITLEALLKHFHTTHTHLAVVEHEERFLGVVTLEDVIEELIGTVRDEFEQVKDYGLAELVPAEAIILDLDGDKESVIRRLVERVSAGRPGVDAAKVHATIMKRERLASTGMGDGIAMPHGRCEGLSRPYAAIGRSKAGVPFDSMDGKPANLVFLILTPVHDEGAHIHILSKISHLLASDYLRQQLLTAEKPEEVLEVFRMSDKSVPA